MCPEGRGARDIPVRRIDGGGGGDGDAALSAIPPRARQPEQH
jgi:hypothetical protein